MDCDSHCHSTCHANLSTPSVHQSLQEMDFERGIWQAAVDGDYIKIQQHLAKGVQPDIQDTSGFTALHYASRNGHYQICELLLQHRANPNIQTNAGNVTPLHRAAICGHADIVRLLIKYGAKLDNCDSDLKTPLHKAAEKGDLETVKTLLQYGGENLKIMLDNKGKRAADYARECSLKYFLS